jgi:hypothetical protein
MTRSDSQYASSSVTLSSKRSPSSATLSLEAPSGGTITNNASSLPASDCASSHVDPHMLTSHGLFDDLFLVVPSSWPGCTRVLMRRLTIDKGSLFSDHNEPNNFLDPFSELPTFGDAEIFSPLNPNTTDQAEFNDWLNEPPALFPPTNSFPYASTTYDGCHVSLC